MTLLGSREKLVGRWHQSASQTLRWRLAGRRFSILNESLSHLEHSEDGIILQRCLELRQESWNFILLH
jgi:hypothetical protein